MTNNQKFGLIILILLTITYIKISFFSPAKKLVRTQVPIIQTDEKTQAEEEPDKKKDEYINIFFIGRNENNEEYYRAVKRKFDKNENGQQLSYAVLKLVEGPNSKEREKGVYTEIPASTGVISVVETSEKAIINLTSDFEQGGGTDGLYKRLYQLVKTANKNTKAPVYLYINNKQADVIGGEGIMINQPLNERIFND